MATPGESIPTAKRLELQEAIVAEMFEIWERISNGIDELQIRTPADRQSTEKDDRLFLKKRDVDEK